MNGGTAIVEVLSFPQQNRHKGFSELPASIRRLLYFAKPDTLICLDDGIRPIIPIFAVEISSHVSARDHWMQRFPNLVGCAQERVPGAYIMPGATPNRPNFSGSVDPLFYYAYDRVMEIHQIPFYIAEWQSTDGETLDRDIDFTDQPDHSSSELKRMFSFINLVIESSIHGRDLSSLMNNRLIVDLRDGVRKIGYQDLPQINSFNRLLFNMPTGQFLSWEEVVDWISEKGIDLPTDLPDRIVKRDRNIIFVPQSQREGKTVDELRATLIDRIEKRSGDPYTGQPLVFDYLFCRLGVSPYERDTNLIIDLSVLSFSDLAKYHQSVWQNSPLRFTNYSEIKHIPTYTIHMNEPLSQLMKTFLRLYFYSADIILFREGPIFF